MTKLPISVQINLAPGDYPLAEHLLERQIQIFHGKVDEIILTLETKKSEGRFGEGWENNRKNLDDLLKAMLQKYDVVLDPIDYRPQMKKQIANYFFGTDFIPEKDHRGGPYYCYFYGLYKAKNNIIFHFDADIFFGGKSQNWIKEAYELHKAPSVFTTSPLPGPPSKNGSTSLKQPIVKELSENKFIIKGFSTRVFTINKEIFKAKKLSADKVGLKESLKSYLKKQAPYALPEKIIGNFMNDHQYKRIDFLGQASGLWSLHPPYKTIKFLSSVGDLLNKIDTEDLPESQIGFYDIVDELFDWTEAREKLKNSRWYKRLFKF